VNGKSYSQGAARLPSTCEFDTQTRVSGSSCDQHSTISISCVLLPPTGIQTPNNKVFTSRFTFPDSAHHPENQIEIIVPDNHTLVSSFLMQYNKDIGGTLKVQMDYVHGHCVSCIAWLLCNWGSYYFYTIHVLNYIVLGQSFEILCQ